MVPRINTLSVRNLRSVGEDWVVLRFPEEGALVLLGENNAGKSNVTRALDILFGDFWPGSRKLEDHDFHGRLRYPLHLLQSRGGRAPAVVV